MPAKNPPRNGEGVRARLRAPHAILACLGQAKARTHAKHGGGGPPRGIPLPRAPSTTAFGGGPPPRSGEDLLPHLNLARMGSSACASIVPGASRPPPASQPPFADRHSVARPPTVCAS